MPNQKVKIVYSLRIHIALQQQGFAYVAEMKNPQNSHLNCWVYAITPAFTEAFEALVEEVASK